MYRQDETYFKIIKIIKHTEKRGICSHSVSQNVNINAKLLLSGNLTVRQAYTDILDLHASSNNNSMKLLKLVFGRKLSLKHEERLPFFVAVFQQRHKHVCESSFPENSNTRGILIELIAKLLRCTAITHRQELP